MSLQIEVPVERAMRQSEESCGATESVVVVGYDGSSESRAAVAVAGERAGPDGKVVVVHVSPAVSDWLGRPYYQKALEAAHEQGEQILDQLHEVAVGTCEVEPTLIEGTPAEALVRVAQARGAREIVVGSRGRGRFRAVLGSVSHELLGIADRPVVVVPRLAVEEDAGS
jgi:nucleotide-binding universal stress UspA family protein